MYIYCIYLFVQKNINYNVKFRMQRTKFAASDWLTARFANFDIRDWYYDNFDLFIFDLFWIAEPFMCPRCHCSERLLPSSTRNSSRNGWRWGHNQNRSTSQKQWTTGRLKPIFSYTYLCVCILCNLESVFCFIVSEILIYFCFMLFWHFFWHFYNPNGYMLSSVSFVYSNVNIDLFFMFIW